MYVFICWFIWACNELTPLLCSTGAIAVQCRPLWYGMVCHHGGICEPHWYREVYVFVLGVLPVWHKVFEFCTISCHISTPKIMLIAYINMPVMLLRCGCGLWSVEKIAYITAMKWWKWNFLSTDILMHSMHATNFVLTGAWCVQIFMAKVFRN